MLESGFASGLDQTSGQNPGLSRRTFMLALSSLLALGSIPGQAEALSDFTPFSFAFISDVHLCINQPDGLALLQQSQLFLSDVVKQLNLRQLDFVIFGGDQVEGPGKDDVNWNLFIDCLQILNAPWYFVLGEADVSGRAVVDKMLEYGPDFKGRGLTTGKPYWSADPAAGVHIVGLDTSKQNTTTGDISAEQLKWLKSDLEANKDKFTIAFSHHPLLAPPPYDSGPPWDDYMVPQGASAREILAEARNVRLCVSGHVPINKIQKEGAVWYVSAATLAIYPCEFKIFTVSPESIRVETHQVSFDAIVQKKAKKIMETSRLAFQYSSTKPQTFLKLAEGEDLDRNAMLPMVSGSVSQKAEKKKVKEKKVREEKPSRSQKQAEKEEAAAKDKKDVPDQTEKKDQTDKKDTTPGSAPSSDSKTTGNTSSTSSSSNTSDLQATPTDSKSSESSKPAASKDTDK